MFKDFQSVNNYCIKYRGEIILLFTEINSKEQIKSDFDDEIITRITTKKEKLYIVNVYKKERLINGFQPIKDIIYLKHSLKMYNTYNKLKELNIEVRAIKTDCLLVNRTHFNDLNNFFDINDNIGGFKIELDKKMNNSKLEIIENELIKFENFEPVVKSFKDEYDSQEINKYIDDKKLYLLKQICQEVVKVK